MLTLEQIKARLVDRKIAKVSSDTRLPERTITRIRDGETKNPDYSTLLILSNYFEQQENTDFGLLKQG